MPAAEAIRVIPLVLLSTAFGFGQQASANSDASDPAERTLFVNCEENAKPKQVLSPVSLSEDGKWRAYVEVDVRSDLGCLHTTRLWVARPSEPYRLVYFMPPQGEAVENGMEILGWAKNSRVLLVKTEAWQWASDADDVQGIAAIDAETGMVYEPRLDAMLEERNGKQCAYRVTDAGFGDDKDVDILVRAKFHTAYDVDQAEEDVPPAKRCGNFEETWSFNFDRGQTKQVANTEPLQIVKKSLPDQGGN